MSTHRLLLTALPAVCLMLSCGAPSLEEPAAPASRQEGAPLQDISAPSPPAPPQDGPILTAVDSASPTTAITTPEPGGTHYGHVLIQATASDDVGVTRVEFYAGSSLLGTDTDAPYSVLWNARTSPTGNLTLTTKAFDAAGNSTTSAGVPVTVARDTVAPTVTCTAPAPGATVGGLVKVEASASDDIGVQRVDFYVGETTLIGRATTPPYSILWDSSTLGDGPKTLTCYAWDHAQNIQTATVSVTTANPQSVTYDALGAPRCRLGVSLCDTRDLTRGQGPQASEPNQPNTLRSSNCADGGYGTFHYSHSVDRITVFPRGGSNIPLTEGQLVRAEITVWASTNSPTGYAEDRLDLYLAADYRNPVWKHLTTLTPSASGEQKLGFTFNLPSGDTQVLRATMREYYDALSPCGTEPFVDHDDLILDVLPALPDAEPPQVSWTAPIANATVSETIPLAVNPTDNTRVSRVELYNSTYSYPMATLDRPPYTSTWNTRTVGNGPQTLTAKVYDSSGNVGTATMNVVVDNDNQAPTVTLTTPVSRGTVSGLYTFKANASDNKGVVRVEYYADTLLMGSSTTAPFDFTYDTLKLDVSPVYFKARAYDAAGNYGTSQEVFAYVYNPGNVAWDPALKVPACVYEHSRCSSDSLLYYVAGLEPHTPNTLDGCADNAWSPTQSAYVDSIGVVSKDGGPLTRGKPAQLQVTYYMPDYAYSSYIVDVYSTTSVSGSPYWTRVLSWTPFKSGYTSPVHDFTLPYYTYMAFRVITRPVSSPVAACNSGNPVDHDDLVFRLK